MGAIRVQVQGYLDRGQSALRAADFPTAADCFSAVITLQPLCEIGYHKRACCYFRQRRFENAVIDFNHAIRLAGDAESQTIHRLYHDLGQAYVKMRDFDQAFESFGMAEQQLVLALESAPSSTPENAPLKSRLRKELAQVQLAQEHCRAARTMNECTSDMRQSAGTSSSFLVLKALAQSYALKGDKQKAQECIAVAEDRQAESEKHELKNTLTRKLSQIGKFLGFASDAEPCRYGLLDPNDDHSS
jgi:tetratricopeptide (TPR) repeat protein